jgi:hypothetical protein
MNILKSEMIGSKSNDLMLKCTKYNTQSKIRIGYTQRII